MSLLGERSIGLNCRKWEEAQHNQNELLNSFASNNQTNSKELPYSVVIGDLYYTAGFKNSDPFNSLPVRENNTSYFREVDHIKKEDIKGHEAWMGSKLDKEALISGSSLLNLVVPNTAKGISKKAISVLLAYTMLVDNTMHAPTWEEWLDKKMCGSTLAFWISQIFQPDSEVDVEYKNYAGETVINNCIAQNTTVQERRRNKERTAEKLVKSATTNFEDFLRWRDREGQFFGTLHLYSLAAGIDLRKIHKDVIWLTLKASMVGYDMHSYPRHKSEDEAGSSLRYFGSETSSHAQKIARMVWYVRSIYDLIISRSDLTKDQTTFLTRFIISGSICIYHCERWMNWSAIHIEPSGQDSDKWTHTYLANGVNAAKFEELKNSSRTI